MPTTTYVRFFLCVFALATFSATACDFDDDVHHDETDAGPGDDADVDDGAVDDGSIVTCGDPLGVPYPTDIASTQTVTLHLSGTGFVVLEGTNCAPLAVSDDSGANVPQRLGFQCGCECARPSIGVTQYFQLGARDVVWDARQLVNFSVPIDCHAGHMPQCITIDDGASQPVAPGHYTIRLPIADAIPESGCSASTSEPGVYDCGIDSSWLNVSRQPSQELCAATRFVDVSVDLPAAGNVEVDVTVPTPATL